MKGFRDFLMRGNLVELAVAVIIATALAAVVKSLIENLIMPVLAALGGKPDFRDLTFTINDAVFRWGAFLTDVITFAIIAAIVYFVIVRPFLAMMAKRKAADEAAAGPTAEDLLTEIRDLLARK